MSKGYVNAAVNLLTNNIENGVLPLNAQTLSQLTDSTKAPILLHVSLPNVHSVWFQPIDVEMVREVCPSGMDADWHIILSSNQFGTSNTDLRKAFAEVIRRLCANFVERKSIEALLSCWLVPLDKNPGLRPIGVRKISMHITGKVIVSLLEERRCNKTTRSFQVYMGQEVGIEHWVWNRGKNPLIEWNIQWGKCGCSFTCWCL